MPVDRAGALAALAASIVACGVSCAVGSRRWTALPSPPSTTSPDAGAIAPVAGKAPEAVDAAEEGDHHDPHHWHPNHLALSLGGMSQLEEPHETSLALGLDYERRLTEEVGVEGLSDFTFGEHSRDLLFAATLTLRPLGGLKLMAGPGFEVGEEKATGHTHADFVLLVGAAYEIPVGPLTLAPTVHWDFVGRTRTNVMYGLGVGVGF